MIERRKNYIWCPNCKSMAREKYPIVDKGHENDIVYSCDICLSHWYKVDSSLMSSREYKEHCKEFSS